MLRPAWDLSRRAVPGEAHPPVERARILHEGVVAQRGEEGAGEGVIDVRGLDTHADGIASKGHQVVALLRSREEGEQAAPGAGEWQAMPSELVLVALDRFAHLPSDVANGLDRD